MIRATFIILSLQFTKKTIFSQASASLPLQHTMDMNAAKKRLKLHFYRTYNDLGILPKEIILYRLISIETVDIRMTITPPNQRPESQMVNKCTPPDALLQGFFSLAFTLLLPLLKQTKNRVEEKYRKPKTEVPISL